MNKLITRSNKLISLIKIGNNQAILQQQPKTLLYYKSIFSNENLLIKRYKSLIEYHKVNYSSGYSSRLQTIELAKQFISTLDLNERQILKEELSHYDEQCNKASIQQPTTNDTTATTTSAATVQRPTWKQLSLVCFQCGLPFIGFGFVDNFLMIIAGDLIEAWVGFYLPISTMAAAGLGNAFSDVAGIGLAHRIEGFALTFVKIPQLTTEQWNLSIINWLTAISKSICIFIGCLIGMTPLLFMPSPSDKHSSPQQQQQSGSDESQS